MTNPFPIPKMVPEIFLTTSETGIFHPAIALTLTAVHNAVIPPFHNASFISLPPARLPIVVPTPDINALTKVIYKLLFVIPLTSPAKAATAKSQTPHS